MTDLGEVSALVAAMTREVADFPEPGIQFKDLTPLLADSHGLAVVTGALAELASGADLIAGIDARGFLLGAAVATKLGTGVLAIRWLLGYLRNHSFYVFSLYTLVVGLITIAVSFTR